MEVWEEKNVKRRVHVRMVNEDKLYILMQELNRAEVKGLITRAAMERVLFPLAGMNEKRQDSYAEEMISVLRTSGDEEEVLVRMQLCMQLISEGAVMEGGNGGQKSGTNDRAEKENSKADGGRRTKITSSKALKSQSSSADKKGEKISRGNKYEAGRILPYSMEYDGEDTGIYLYRFMLPIDKEEKMVNDQAWQNGGNFGYVDNDYPCGIFDIKELSEIIFSKVTIFYGGNGSGKSTLLNLIANRLELNRVAPFNSGELFDRYKESCEYVLGHDEEGFALRIPSGSRIITSDDVFDYMLAMRAQNEDISEGKIAAKEQYAECEI